MTDWGGRERDGEHRHEALALQRAQLDEQRTARWWALGGVLLGGIFTITGAIVGAGAEKRPEDLEASPEAGLPARNATPGPARAPSPRPADPCQGVAPTCDSDLFVQLATPAPSTPTTYDFPLTRKLFDDFPAEFSGTRVIETFRDGKRVLGAIVKNRCYADKLAPRADEALHSRPQIMCEHIDVSRVVFVVP